MDNAAQLQSREKSTGYEQRSDASGVSAPTCGTSSHKWERHDTAPADTLTRPCFPCLDADKIRARQRTNCFPGLDVSKIRARQFTMQWCTWTSGSRLPPLNSPSPVRRSRQPKHVQWKAPLATITAIAPHKTEALWWPGAGQTAQCDQCQGRVPCHRGQLLRTEEASIIFKCRTCLYPPFKTEFVPDWE